MTNRRYHFYYYLGVVIAFASVAFIRDMGFSFVTGAIVAVVIMNVARVVEYIDGEIDKVR